MMLTIFVSGPKQPGDRIDVYLRPQVDDLKILRKPGVPEVWDDYKHEEFTMHGMLFATINDNPEGPIRRTREGGSEWEPITILLEGDGNSNKMNTTSNTRL
jgi:hypothetical protein